MAIDLLGGIEKLESIGFYDVILPFLLIFTLTFAILERARLFGQDSRKFNAIIALVLGMLIIRQGDIVTFINTYLPNVSAIVIVFLGFLIIMGLFGVGHSAFTGGLMFVFVILAIAGGIWALTESADNAIDIPGTDWNINITDEDAGVLLVFGLILGLFLWAIGSKPKPKGLEGFLKGASKVGDAFSGRPIP